jgi:hypothetical protein
MNKTLNQAKTDAVGSFKDAYAFEFKEFKKEHDKLITNPNCGICIKGFFNLIRKDPNKDAKLEMIYGEKVSLDLSQLAITYTPQTKSQTVARDSWTTWFDEIMLTSEQARNPRILSCVNDGDNIMVTYIEQIKHVEED